MEKVKTAISLLVCVFNLIIVKGFGEIVFLSVSPWPKFFHFKFN